MIVNSLCDLLCCLNRLDDNMILCRRLIDEAICFVCDPVQEL